MTQGAEGGRKIIFLIVSGNHDGNERLPNRRGWFFRLLWRRLPRFPFRIGAVYRSSVGNGLHGAHFNPNIPERGEFATGVDTPWGADGGRQKAVTRPILSNRHTPVLAGHCCSLLP